MHLTLSTGIPDRVAGDVSGPDMILPLSTGPLVAIGAPVGEGKVAPGHDSGQIRHAPAVFVSR